MKNEAELEKEFMYEFHKLTKRLAFIVIPYSYRGIDRRLLTQPLRKINKE